VRGRLPDTLAAEAVLDGSDGTLKEALGGDGAVAMGRRPVVLPFDSVALF